jgi:hypothetical protein
MLNGPSFFRTVEKGILRVFKASLHDINKAIAAKDRRECPLVEIVPEQYHEFLPLFSTALAHRLSLYQPGIDHELPLKEGEIPPWGPLYSMSRAELVVSKEWLEENMSKGLIPQSLSRFTAQVFLAKKSDGGLRFCIDYRNVNSKLIKDRYPIQLITET